MLDLPELLDKVCQLLGRDDLMRCALVSYAWHSVVIPHLWRDLSWISSRRSRDAFRMLVLEDYLAEQQRRERQEKGQDIDQTRVPLLSKYGQWIRLLPSATGLLERILLPKPPVVQDNRPTAQELFYHLFKRCPSNVQLHSLRYELKGSDPDEMKSILAFTVPRVRNLYLRASFQGTPSESLRLKNILYRCSTVLTSLNLNVTVLSPNKTADMEVEPTEMGPDCWTALKELSLQHCPDTSDTQPFWSWLWKRCGRVERLKVYEINRTTQSLAHAMFTYMPNLREITLGYHVTIDPDTNLITDVVITDETTAQLLSGSCNGWRVVSIMSSAEFGKATMSALSKHFSTLEKLQIDGSWGLPTSYLVRVLRSCAHIHTLIYADLYSIWASGSSLIDGKYFIDMDPATGLLKPWTCEGSLKLLMLKIVGIPRPATAEHGILEEAYPGERLGVHGVIYDRLARLTNLETLWLGDHYRMSPAVCLEMSLESGLDRLAGLKKLRELNVFGLKTKIGVKEVQWMAEQWPCLRVLRGLDESRGDEEAVRWLRANCPRIKVSASWRD